ncbi:GNAT family N-acetyltransferase [Embleya sp. NPDC005575]|uniref:GNAT family N-acetyltransferase n=1 Tax=Embleya sp. NPDC005575 TaxID=3156892 RepID=UPI0033B6BE94
MDATGTGHRKPVKAEQPDAPARTGGPASFIGTAGSALVPLAPADLPDLHDFLVRADLTLSGLDAAGVRLWLLRDGGGRVCGSTGYELSATGDHALIRSVAVDREARGRGLGLELAHFALDHAAAAGARRAWLFSRRSGPFWQRLGFEPADRTRLASFLADTHQVTLFRASGQLDREVAWSRDLGRGASHPTPVR